MTLLKQYIKLLQWHLKGHPFPPPHLIKQRMIRTAAEGFGTRVLVETGTLFGDMVEAMKGRFRRVYSIEISPELAHKASRRFAADANVRIIEGDSMVALKDLLPEIREPALFWLDGHYSGGITGKGEKETPITEEVDAIFATPYPHVVMIDDARCFGTEKDYPTLDALKSHILALRPGADILVENDCIRITPRQG